ncbi:MAG TPA: hypothetical protein VJN21_14280 [Candidatus Acidoferrales bacterium]|nr:hypothetical protein [Candidatus Acidoferrales bacterium]
MAKNLADRILSIVLGTLAACGGFAMLEPAFRAYNNWQTFRSYEDAPVSGWHASYPVFANWTLTMVLFYVAARFFWYAFAAPKQD